MGFGGATAAMATILKNNNRRTKREAFDGFTSNIKESEGIPVKPISEEALENVRKKIKAENRLLKIKRVVAFCIVFPALLFGLIFYLKS